MRALDRARAATLFKLSVDLAKAIRNEAAEKIAADLLASVSPAQASVATPAVVELRSIKPPPPLVSIIIPTFNKLELTRQCLAALAANTPALSCEQGVRDDWRASVGVRPSPGAATSGLPPRPANPGISQSLPIAAPGDGRTPSLTHFACEIIVVDNGSTDGTPDFLQAAQAAGTLRAILNSENTGFAKACNQGARTALGKYILFLNNDTEVRAGWLEPLVAVAEADSRVGAVGGKLLFPNGTIQHAGVALASTQDGDPLLGFHLFAGEKGDFALAGRRRICQAVTAACLLVRKVLFEQAGGFDEEFYNGYEDVDLCLRLQERGFVNVYEPASVVTHHESQSGPERFKRVGENIRRFHQKWLGQASPDVRIDQNGKASLLASNLARACAAPPRPPVSIIVLAHNQINDTRLCLASIEQHTRPSYELILVDNNSTDGTTDLFRQYAASRARVRVVLNRANLGFAAGNNQGLAIARGENLLLLNNDTVVTAGWLERLLDVLARHPEAGLVGPVSNSVSGPQLIKTDYSCLPDMPPFAARWSEAHAGETTEAARLVGFCLLLRRAVLEKIGGLDTQYGNGNFEDDDLCIRAGLAGFKMRIAWDCFVHHTGGQTFKGAKMDYRAGMLRNWELFKAKWAMPKDAPLEKGYRFPAAVPPGVSLNFTLPELPATHTPSLEGRCWTDRATVLSQPAALPKSGKKQVVIQLPPCALLGRLAGAREKLRQQKLPSAWEETLAAIQARPFHPEAFLLLGEIARAAGDAASALRCAKHARELAPEWKPAKKFLNGSLRGTAKPSWLVLPPALSAAPLPTAPRLSVCLIVKNEQEFLGRCLASVRALASQIVVVDTGSTDRTLEIAREHGAEIHHFAWCDDFAAARNAALERATGDWVLTLDADEELLPGQAETLAREMQSAGIMALRLPIIDKGRENEGCSYVPRLFRNAPGLFFLGRLHEQPFSSIEARCQEWGLRHVLGKTTLLHYGYMKEVVESRHKVERNLRLLQSAMAELPDEPNLVMNLGLELIRSGQREAGVRRYWEAVELLAAQPVTQIVPELRETLLSQLTTHLIAGKDFAGVVKLWQTPLAKTGGMTASHHFGLGLALMELKQPAEAAAQMRQCLAKRAQPALSPVNREILQAGPNHCLALCLSALKEKDAAAQAFAAALSDDPSSRRLRLDFARFQAERGQPLEALRQLNDLVAENPAEAQVWEMGSQIALSRNEFLEFARDWTGEAIKHFPEHPAILRHRAEALLLTQDFECALPLWLKSRPSGSPRSMSAVILCELLTDGCRRQLTPSDEPLVSQELLKWYRQLIALHAHSAANQLHERMDAARRIVPGFVRAWEAATTRVRETMAA
jgi:GT2 family glycosyltransferase/tetratricopeptide (TPR) repeat protein